MVSTSLKKRPHVQCKVYNVQCTVHSVHCEVYSVHCAVYSVQFTVCNMQCVEVQWTLFLFPMDPCNQIDLISYTNQSIKLLRLNKYFRAKSNILQILRHTSSTSVYLVEVGVAIQPRPCYLGQYSQKKIQRKIPNKVGEHQLNLVLVGINFLEGCQYIVIASVYVKLVSLKQGGATHLFS